jgi:hypothetical protein
VRYVPGAVQQLNFAAPDREPELFGQAPEGLQVSRFNFISPQFASETTVRANHGSAWSICILYHTHIVCYSHTMCQEDSTRNRHAFEYNVGAMRKDTALSFRVPRRLKAELQKVALTEGRSLAQVCEALLGGGLEIYEAEGSKSLQRLLSRPQKKSSD